MDHSLEEILQAEEQIRQAMTKDDLPALERLLHNELVFTDFTGAVVGKQDDIASHASGVVKLAEVEFVEEPVVRQYGEIAVVAVKTHVTGSFQGAPFDSLYRYLRVWRFEDERWQIIAGNVSAIA